MIDNAAIDSLAGVMWRKLFRSRPGAVMRSSYIRIGVTILAAVTLGIALAGCIESKAPLLPESQAITSLVPGQYVTNTDVMADTDAVPKEKRGLVYWNVSLVGKQYHADRTTELPTGILRSFVGHLVGTLHPFDDHHFIFQFRGDENEGADNKYSYWLLNVRSDWILINTIECDKNILKTVGEHGSCNDIESRRALIALAKIANQHSSGEPKEFGEDDFLFSALRIQNR